MTSRAPSGEKDVGNWIVVRVFPFIRSTAPVPSAACQKRLGTPSRCDEKSNTLTVRRPDRTAVEPRVEGQAREEGTRHVPDPDVVFLIPDVQRDLGAVRGQVQIHVGPRRCRDASSRPCRSTHTSVRGAVRIDAPAA